MEKGTVYLNKLSEDERQDSKNKFIDEITDALGGMNSVDNALCFIENGSDLEDNNAGGVFIKAYASSKWMAFMIYHFIRENSEVGKQLAIMMLREEVETAMEKGDHKEAMELTQKALKIMNKSNPEVN